MKVSVITVVLNNKAGLTKTIESIREQSFGDYELIVVDGGSSDGTVELIEQHRDVVSRWISERDAGIYDAMNKGISLARGEYLLFLNSGDYFANPNSLESVFESEDADHPVTLIYCDSYEEDLAGRKYLKRARHPSRLYLGMFTHHQAMFFSRAAVGSGYEANYRIAGDYALVCRLLRMGSATTRYIPIPVTVFEEGGFSQRNISAGRQELLRIQAVVLQYGVVVRSLVFFRLIAASALRRAVPSLYRIVRFK